MKVESQVVPDVWKHSHEIVNGREGTEKGSAVIADCLRSFYDFVETTLSDFNRSYVLYPKFYLGNYGAFSSFADIFLKHSFYS